MFGRQEPSRAERTAADRERARLERERRRAAREGRPLPAQEPPQPQPEAGPSPQAPPPEPVEPALAQEWQAPAEQPPAADFEARAEPPVRAEPPARAEPSAPPSRAEPPAPAEPPASVTPPRRAEPPAPAEPPASVTPPRRAEPPAPAEPSAPAEPPASSRRAEPSARPAPGPPPAGPRPPAPSTPPPARAEPTTPEPEPTAPLEPVAPARRTVRLPRAAHADDAPIGVKAVDYEPQPGAPGLPPNRSLVTPRKRRTGRRVAALALVLLLLAGAYGAVRLFQPFGTDPGDEVAVRIPEGAGASDIGRVLADAGVVDSATLFALRARIDGGQGLRSGPHTLNEDMTYADALAKLREAPEAAPTISVTLPEGPSIEENAARVKAAGVRGDYVRAARRARVKARELGLPRKATTPEGFLFPATFELRRGATAADLVDRQLEAYGEQVGEIDLRAAKRADLSRYEVLVIASMVEREAQVPKERRIIAGVIYNRLREGIPLGIDATIRYDLDNWDRPLRVSELERDSPFNTRLRAGLPPTPIGNPGAEAIKAAAAPAEHDLLFYVVKPCGNGAHAFSEDSAQFERDVAAYNKARDERGGRDPSQC